MSEQKQTGTAVVLPVLTHDRTEKRQNGRRFKENGDPAFTLTSEDRHGVAVGINTEKDGSCRTLRAQHNLFDPINLSRDDSYGATGAGIKIMGTLDPNRHSQMDVHDEGGIMSCLDNIQEKKKVGIPINREPEDPPG